MDTSTPGWAPATARLRVYRAEDNASSICPVPPINELDGTLEGVRNGYRNWLTRSTRSVWA